MAIYCLCTVQQVYLQFNSLTSFEYIVFAKMQSTALTLINQIYEKLKLIYSEIEVNLRSN